MLTLSLHVTKLTFTLITQKNVQLNHLEQRTESLEETVMRRCCAGASKAWYRLLHYEYEYKAMVSSRYQYRYQCIPISHSFISLFYVVFVAKKGFSLATCRGGAISNS